MSLLQGLLTRGQREDRVHTPCRAFPSKIAYKKCISVKEEEL